MIQTIWPSCDWTVFHVPTCTFVERVMWVDDATHRMTYHCDSPICLLHEHQFRKIVILRPNLTVLLDPLDDLGDGVVEREHELSNA